MPQTPATGPTAPTQMRLSRETLAQIDWLAADLGGLSRTDAVRAAVNALCARRGGPRASPPRRKSRKKS